MVYYKLSKKPRKLRIYQSLCSGQPHINWYQVWWDHPGLMDGEGRRTVPAAIRHAANGQLDFDIVSCRQGTKDTVYSAEHISKYI